MYTVCFKKALAEFGISQVAVKRSEAGGRSCEQLWGELEITAGGQTISEPFQKRGETCGNTWPWGESQMCLRDWPRARNVELLRERYTA